MRSVFLSLTHSFISSKEFHLHLPATLPAKPLAFSSIRGWFIYVELYVVLGQKTKIVSLNCLNFTKDKHLLPELKTKNDLSKSGWARFVCENISCLDPFKNLRAC